MRKILALTLALMLASSQCVFAGNSAWTGMTTTNNWKQTGSDLYYDTGNVAIADTNRYGALTVGGVTAMAETTAPGLQAGYGKLYVKSSDHKIYFKTQGGVEYDLTAAAGSGAPTDAQYIVATHHSGLLDDRILTQGAGITVTDSGTPAGAMTISIGATQIKSSMVDWGTGAGQISTADIPELTNEYYTDGKVGTYSDLHYLQTVDAPLSLPTLSGQTGKVLSNNGSTLGWIASATSNHASLSNLTYVTSGHTGFEPTVVKGNLSETGSSVLTITGGTGAVIGGSGCTIQVTQATASNSGFLTNSDWSLFSGKESVLTFSSGLTRNTNTVTNNLITGLSGGQTVMGGTAAGDDLNLQSTMDVTRGSVNCIDDFFMYGDGTVTDAFYWTNGHVTDVPIAGDINTYLTAATAGDTLQLGAGTYTITAEIAANKLIHIRGMGRGITKILCATANIYMIDFSTTDGSALSDLTLQDTATTNTSSTAMVHATTGANIHNVEFLNSATSSTSYGQSAVRVTGSATLTVNVESCVFTTTGVAGWHFATDNQDSSATINVRNCLMTGASGSTAGIGNIVVYNSLGTTNVYNCYIADTAAKTGGAVYNNSGTMNVYTSTINSSGAGAFDAKRIAGTLTLYGTVLVNGTTSGTVSYGGNLATAKLQIGYGAATYAVTLSPNAAMSQNVDLQLPAAYPAGTYFLKVGSTGAMTYDSATYLTAEADTLQSVVTRGSATTLAASFGNLQSGYNGASGVMRLYSEQGATDHTADIAPNAAMTADATFHLPAAQPAATYIMTMTSGGVMGFDTNQYVDLTTGQTVGGVKAFTSFPTTPSAYPSANYEVANKAYVDSVSSGMRPKTAVRGATAAAGTLATDFENGDTIDTNVVLVTNDRILIKDQAAPAENGIYTVNASGAPTRATDSDTAAEVTAGAFSYVTEGTANIGKQFIQTLVVSNLGVDPLSYTVLYAPISETLDTVTTRGATTANAVTVGGVTDTGATYYQGIMNLGNGTAAVAAGTTHVYVNTTAGAQVNLPAATGSGRNLVIKRKDATAYTVTIHADTTGTPDLIDGQADILLSNQYDSITLHDSAANEWSIN